MRRLIRLSLAIGAVTALGGGLLAVAETGSAAVPESALTAPEAALAQAATSGPTPAPTPAPTSAPTSAAAKPDFNGDGRADIAVGNPNATVSGQTGAGKITAFYGGADGLSFSRRQVITQNTPGMAEEAEEDDGFGYAHAVGDFNADGYSDLAVSAPHEGVVGRVFVLWGSPGGLTGGTAISRPSTTVSSWGSTMTAGDFDGDGRSDLVATGHSNVVFTYDNLSPSPGSRSVSSRLLPISMALGGVEGLTAGDANGDGRDDLIARGMSAANGVHDTHFWVPGTAAGLAVPPFTRTLPAGESVAIGDINGDSYGDVVIGLPWDDSWNPGVPGHLPPGTVPGGKVTVRYGSASGPSHYGRIITQGTDNIPSSASPNRDQFGYSLSLGDINGDGKADLAIGARGKDINGVEGPGAVTVLYGTAAGPNTSLRIQQYAQSSPGVPGDDEPGDFFGHSLGLTDVNGDGKADLTILAPQKGQNSLTTLLSNGQFITTVGATVFDPHALGVTHQLPGTNS
ncbi:FG-GAP and VCBS repeat-containing protein [Streptomyces sp. SCSIO 30461]|uniref:FG-GAP and VCBS repeat-containing protein n=1 Tax=Streptomyces sp. SCSIO 30461 TaxID=3118085 RepID=UPI0030D3968F